MLSPPARAGRFGAGDELIELRALLAVQAVAAPVAVGFESAMFLYGFAEHQPQRPVIVHRAGWRKPKSLSEFRSAVFDWTLRLGEVEGLPVLAPASAVVAVAERPEMCGDWANADTWLMVTTIVDDPTYLALPFVTTSHFKKLPNAAGWDPQPCSSR